MKELFSVPYGIAKDGTPLLAEVRLSAPLRPGHLGRIARQVATIAAVAEQPLDGPEQDAAAAAEEGGDDGPRARG